MELTITNLPFLSADDGVWQPDGDGGLVGNAGPTTDLFVDPATGTPTLTAPRLLTARPPADFQLSARVEVDFASTYDAGCLLAWADSATWAKLCFEFSPQGEPMIVSVVTRGVSDDANALVVDGNAVWLRLSLRGGNHYAFHASTDGSYWRLVRHFSLGDAVIDVGFVVQSPTGEGVTATFTDVRYRPEPVAELRDGT